MRKEDHQTRSVYARFYILAVQDIVSQLSYLSLHHECPVPRRCEDGRLPSDLSWTWYFHCVYDAELQYTFEKAVQGEATNFDFPLESGHLGERVICGAPERANLLCEHH